ncbi:oxidoreductase [Caballeronia fortuita]|uniref:Oxidoreductase n=1 Tax=Caballeronia fortuita TaxID=1777138 RepID=A0A158CAQ8_9BURK|nr:oxidoreductase [Caballeronia fortuita]
MSSIPRLKLIDACAAQADDKRRVLRLSNDADPMTFVDELSGVERIELAFPHFTDGRAYSQAYLLRRRIGFSGDIRATGDVQIDQLLQMARTGFSSAVLNPGLDSADAARHLERFTGFYQRDLAGN